MEGMPRNTAIRILAEPAVPHLSSTDRGDILLSDWWCLDEEDEEFHILPKAIQEAIQTYEVPPDPDNAIYDPLLLQSLMDKYVGVKTSI